MYLIEDDYVVSRSAKPKRTNNRKRIIFDDVFSHNEKTYRVNANKSGLYVEILNSMIEQFDIALTKWKRVFVYRFDLHTDYYTKDNKKMSEFISRLSKRLKREHGFKNIGYCWVREQERAKSQHYHWVLFLDGDLIQHSNRLTQVIKSVWERPTGGYYVPTIKNPFYFVDNKQAAQEAIYRVSYLAKSRGKGYRDKQTNDFQCSRMKVKRSVNMEQ